MVCVYVSAYVRRPRMVCVYVTACLMLETQELVHFGAWLVFPMPIKIDGMCVCICLSYQQRYVLCQWMNKLCPSTRTDGGYLSTARSGIQCFDHNSLTRINLISYLIRCYDVGFGCLHVFLMNIDFFFCKGTVLICSKLCHIILIHVLFSHFHSHHFWSL